MHNEKHTPIFIINLRRSVDRREHMIEEMEKVGLSYEFIDAVDGKELNREYIEETKKRGKLFAKRFGRELTVGEIGCAMSHMKVYEKMVRDNISHAIILEDDITVPNKEEFIHFYTYIENAITSYQLIHFSYALSGKFLENNFFRFISFQYKGRRYIPSYKGEKRFVARPTQNTQLLAGYAIAKGGAAKFIEHGHPIRMPSDCLTGDSEIYGVSFGLYSKQIVRLSSHYSLSTIGDKDRREGITYSPNKTLSSIKRLMFQHRITLQCYKIVRSFYHFIKCTLVMLGLMDYKKYNM